MTLSIDDIKSIGIIGAGQMGSGIAQVAALAGYEVRLEDVSAKALDAAIANIGKNLERQVARGKLGEEEKDAAMKRIRTGSDFKPLNGCDVVIEAATEREDLKREIYTRLVP
ncbi:MAG TPA: 3-hydroxyacyl-CoA dehydrogenase NAD-binding domain-containing protein, partial [Stellaceae bacterium]|nr:3-hydroxyacyl-CoA dehydrogenase NAD-binding domain-containing protein [Stellaceae bacterium]